MSSKIRQSQEPGEPARLVKPNPARTPEEVLKLLKWLGIPRPEETRDITIHLPAQGVPSIQVEYHLFALAESQTEVETEVVKFHLHAFEATGDDENGVCPTDS